MLFNAAFFSGLLLSPVVLALSSGLSARIARRGESSQGNNRLERDTVDSNFGGAWLSEDNGTFTGVAGTVTVPSASGPNGSSALIWLTLNGMSYSNVTLGAGVSVNVDDQVVTYGAWCERLPDFNFQLFPDPIQISAGDVLNIIVHASSPNSGTVMIENLNNSQVVSNTLCSSTPLCAQDVEWGVIDFGSDDCLTPIADFGTVTFTNAYATGNNSLFSPYGANTTVMAQNGTVLANVTTNETSLTIQHT